MNHQPHHIQAGILEAIPAHATYLTFELLIDVAPALIIQSLQKLQQLHAICDGQQAVIGFGLPLFKALNSTLDGLRDFPQLSLFGKKLPAEKWALWIWLRNEQMGESAAQVRTIIHALQDAFLMTTCTEAFKFKEGRDLTGYEDGTENPIEQAALNAAIVQSNQVGVSGSSFVAVQQWEHLWDKYNAMSPAQHDVTIGRQLSDNEEIEDAPESAHVKRTAQESFEPEAFVLRRSMPWSRAARSGLMFVAFGHSFDAFEAQFKRMIGADDGIVDALFTFSVPITGSYFWCPPMHQGQLDLSLLIQ